MERNGFCSLSFNNEGKWLSVLKDIKDIANKNVRELVKARFYNTVTSSLLKRSFAIEDLDAKIFNLTASYEREKNIHKKAGVNSKKN